MHTKNIHPSISDLLIIVLTHTRAKEAKKLLRTGPTQEGRRKTLLCRYTHKYKDQVGLLKKRLQLEFKGMLSKSTQSDSTLGIPVVIRFKCKNFTATNNCPFNHYLEFCREEEGKILYKHKIVSSKHNPECTLDDENIQYNMIVRKLDSSTNVIENIVSKGPTLKPKEILDIFTQQIHEDENFLYEGLHTKSVKRSIKKYFDNLVAKVKSKFKN